MNSIDADRGCCSSPSASAAADAQTLPPIIPTAHASVGQLQPPLQSANCAAVVPCHQQTPPPSPGASTTDACLFDYRGKRVAGFQVGTSCRIFCLPQMYELFLRQFVGGLHTVYTKLKRLGIQPLICSVEQVRALRNLGAIQSGVNRCKLIETGDFETLYRDCTNAGVRPGRPLKRTISDNARDTAATVQPQQNATAATSSASADWRSTNGAQSGTESLLEPMELPQRHSDQFGLSVSSQSDDQSLNPFITNHHHLLQHLLHDQTTTFGLLDQCHKQQQQETSRSSSSSSSNTTAVCAHQLLLLGFFHRAIVAASVMAAATAQHEQQQQHGEQAVQFEQQQQQQQMPSCNNAGADGKRTTDSNNDNSSSRGDDNDADNSPVLSSLSFLSSSSAAAAAEEQRSRRDSSAFTSNSSSVGRGAEERSGSEEGGPPGGGRAAAEERVRDRRRKHFTGGGGNNDSNSIGGGQPNDGRRAAESSSNISTSNSESPSAAEGSPPSSGDGYCSSSFNNSESYRSSDQQQQRNLLNRLNMVVDRAEKVLMDQCQYFYAMVDELKLARQCQEKSLLRCRAEKRRSEIHQKYSRLRRRKLLKTACATSNTTTSSDTTTADKRLGMEEDRGGNGFKTRIADFMPQNVCKNGGNLSELHQSNQPKRE